MSDDPLSDEDKALFRKMMGSVKPLQKTNKIKLSAASRTSKLNSTSISSTPHLFLSNYYTEEVKAHTILSYTQHKIPGKRLRELKMGLIPWKARLDLHGLNSDAARETLIRFIEKHTALAHRCLLIIHGKGSYNSEPPILKNLINHWLPQFPQVLAFHSALARDGGEGALYVLLKRQKK